MSRRLLVAIVMTTLVSAANAEVISLSCPVFRPRVSQFYVQVDTTSLIVRTRDQEGCMLTDYENERLENIHRPCLDMRSTYVGRQFVYIDENTINFGARNDEAFQKICRNFTITIDRGTWITHTPSGPLTCSKLVGSIPPCGFGGQSF
jgi:hypothetical protein